MKERTDLKLLMVKNGESEFNNFNEIKGSSHPMVSCGEA
jgi:hypothetical protein